MNNAVKDAIERKETTRKKVFLTKRNEIAKERCVTVYNKKRERLRGVCLRTKKKMSGNRNTHTEEQVAVHRLSIGGIKRGNYFGLELVWRKL